MPLPCNFSPKGVKYLQPSAGHSAALRYSKNKENPACRQEVVS